MNKLKYALATLLLITILISCQQEDRTVNFDFLVGKWTSKGYNMYEVWSKVNDTEWLGYNYKYFDTLGEYKPIILDSMKIVSSNQSINLILHLGRTKEQSYMFKDSIFITDKDRAPKQIQYLYINSTQLLVKAGDNISEGKCYLFNYFSFK